MSTEMFLPSDEQLRGALTREPSPGLAAAVFAEIAGELDRAPQVRRRVFGWPLSSPLPGVGPSIGRRRHGTVALVVLALLALLAGIAVVGLVGALRPPPPFGLARPGLIAYDSSGQIFVADADGSNPRAITSGAEAAIEPTYSLDGTRLAWFALEPSTSVVRLMVAGADGSGAHPIAALAAEAAKSGTRIAYLRIAWSPDGRRIAYAAPVGGRAQVFVAGVDGGGPVPVGDADLEGHDPAWSPDGRRLAFHGGRYDEDRGIYVVDVEAGSQPGRITPVGRLGVYSDESYEIPAWSPDGTWIAYSAIVVDADESHVFVVPASGGQPRDVSGRGTNDWGPVWSPDGTWLAWRAGRSGYPGRFVVGRPDGSQRSELSPTVLGQPVWSPDGRKLVGAAPNETTGVTDRLLIIDMASDRVVTIPAGPNGDASWQRLGP